MKRELKNNSKILAGLEIDPVINKVANTKIRFQLFHLSIDLVDFLHGTGDFLVQHFDELFVLFIKFFCKFVEPKAVGIQRLFDGRGARDILIRSFAILNIEQ